MNYRQLSVVTSLLVMLSGAVGAQAGAISLGERASLQATMQKHIERALVNDRYLHLDDASGEVRALRPLAAHPIMLQMGEHFVLCADFRAADGSTVNVDFYLARKGKSFVVFDERVENRALVERLMKDGKASRL